MSRNLNRIVTGGFSSLATKRLYDRNWPLEPALHERHDRGAQCGGCAYFAVLNADWGICCHPRARHRLETVFEHFTCPSYAAEGWGPHSFSDRRRCQCGGIEISPEKPRQELPLRDRRHRSRTRTKRG